MKCVHLGIGLFAFGHSRLIANMLLLGSSSEQRNMFSLRTRRQSQARLDGLLQDCLRFQNPRCVHCVGGLYAGTSFAVSFCPYSRRIVVPLRWLSELVS